MLITDALMHEGIIVFIIHNPTSSVNNNLVSKRVKIHTRYILYV